MASVPPAAAGFFPLDDELALLPGQLTPRLQEGLVRLGTQIPSFARARDEFAYWTQVPVDRATVVRLTEAAGATAVAHETARATQLLQTMPPPCQTPDRLLISVDGAMVPLVHGQWKEVRTLAVGEPIPTTTPDGTPTVQTQALSYFSRLADSTTFTDLATVELHRRGVDGARQVGAVVDGADWCQTFLDLQRPDAVRVLDFPHAAGYITAIGQTSGDAGPLLDADTCATLRHDLKHHGPADVLPRLRQIVTAANWPAETATQLAYLETRADQLAYSQFQADGWPIGSGSVESANKLVVEARLKGAGMHWAEGHVNPMLALRNAICSDRWAEVWAQVAADHRQQVRERQQARRHRRSPPMSPAAAREPTHSGEAPRAPTPPRIVDGRPTAQHPWKHPWSVRRQKEIAAGP